MEAVTIAEVGPDRKPIPGTEERYTCDTLLLSCGLLPENELSKSAGVELSQVTSGPVVNDSFETSVQVSLLVEMYFTYTIWWTLYLRRQRQPERMQLLILKQEKKTRRL